MQIKCPQCGLISEYIDYIMVCPACFNVLSNKNVLLQYKLSACNTLIKLPDKLGSVLFDHTTLPIQKTPKEKKKKK